MHENAGPRGGYEAPHGEVGLSFVIDFKNNEQGSWEHVLKLGSSLVAGALLEVVLSCVINSKIMSKVLGSTSCTLDLLLSWAPHFQWDFHFYKLQKNNEQGRWEHVLYLGSSLVVGAPLPVGLSSIINFKKMCKVVGSMSCSWALLLCGRPA